MAARVLHAKPLGTTTYANHESDFDGGYRSSLGARVHFAQETLDGQVKLVSVNP